MTTSDIINLCLTIVTIIIATIALWQTQKQTKLSNKQQLFDRRLEQYHLIKELLSLYEQERNLLQKDKTIAEGITSHFIFLTNNSRLESMASVISNPLGQEEKINFLKKCEMLEKATIEITLIWKEDCAKDLSEFVSLYVKLLKSLHKQAIIIKNLEEENKQKNAFGHAISLDVYLKKLNDWAENNKLFELIKLIEESFIKIKNTNAEQKLKESLMLY